MADMFDKYKRSEIMSRIRSQDTKAEIIVFKYLRKEKIYFQKHYKRVVGNPDIALPRKRKAVFIDGDFWHGRNPERIEKLPKVYWRGKILKNVARDNVVRQKLKSEGWTILRIWEKELTRKHTQQEQLDRIASFLNN